MVFITLTDSDVNFASEQIKESLFIRAIGAETWQQQGRRRSDGGAESPTDHVFSLSIYMVRELSCNAWIPQNVTLDLCTVLSNIKSK